MSWIEWDAMPAEKTALANQFVVKGQDLRGSAPIFF